MRSKPLPSAVVLVIEDDPDLRVVLQSTLEAYGYATRRAENGAEGLALLRRERVDVVLLDLMMPVMNGWQFREQQRADPELSQIPVVVLSAAGGEDVLGLEADAYLEKPIDARFLVANVQRALRVAEARRLADAERRAAVGTLAAATAHEINNPLAYVVANLQELVEGLGQPGSSERSEELVVRAREALDGALRIRDVVGELCASVSRESQPAEPRLRSERVASQPPARRGHVLVVDDEPEVARAIGRLLVSDHDVRVCFGGREALELLADDPSYDVVVSDVIMPELGGAELYAEIARRHPGLQQRIVFVTGAACTEASRAFLSNVKNVCLRKPIDRGALLDAIERRLEESLS